MLLFSSTDGAPSGFKFSPVIFAETESNLHKTCVLVMRFEVYLRVAVGSRTERKVAPVSVNTHLSIIHRKVSCECRS